MGKDSVVQVPPRTILVQEGQRSRKMFIIRSGKVRVYKSYLGQKVTLAVLGVGEIFGELSFFDAEPRSASVETLTECILIEIDGDEASRQIEQLPAWVIPVLRKVFYRFREADQKIAVLQSLNEFQKRSLKKDGVGQSIFVESLRFIKTLRILLEKHQPPLLSAEIQKEMDEVIGQRLIGLKVFWNLLVENHMLVEKVADEGLHVSINEKMLTDFCSYLSSELEKERCLILSHSSVAVLRKLIGHTQQDGEGIVDQAAAEGSEVPQVIIAKEALRLENLPLHEEAVMELTRYNIIKEQDGNFIFSAKEVHDHFVYQNILKSFDHTIIQLD